MWSEHWNEHSNSLFQRSFLRNNYHLLSMTSQKNCKSVWRLQVVRIKHAMYNIQPSTITIAALMFIFWRNKNTDSRLSRISHEKLSNWCTKSDVLVAYLISFLGTRSAKLTVGAALPSPPPPPPSSVSSPPSSVSPALGDKPSVGAGGFSSFT